MTVILCPEARVDGCPFLWTHPGAVELHTDFWNRRIQNARSGIGTICRETSVVVEALHLPVTIIIYDRANRAIRTCRRHLSPCTADVERGAGDTLAIDRWPGGAPQNELP